MQNKSAFQADILTTTMSVRTLAALLMLYSSPIGSAELNREQRKSYKDSVTSRLCSLCDLNIIKGKFCHGELNFESNMVPRINVRDKTETWHLSETVSK